MTCNIRFIRSKYAIGTALAIMGSSVQAQGSVTLYGIVDAGLQYASQTADEHGRNQGSTFAMTDAGAGPSVLGLTGVEDLGGGLKANFALESGIDVVNGGLNSSNGNFFGRQAWVGLNGGFGEVRLGAQFSPFFLTILELDPRNCSSFGSALILYGDAVAYTGATNSNALLYTTPQLGGLQGSLMFAPGGIAGDFQAGRQWSADLRYENGPLVIKAAIYDGNAGGAITPTPTTVEFEGRTIGAVYRLGTLTAKASFTNYKVAASFNNNIYGAGLDWQVSASADITSGIWFTSDRNRTANHSVLAAIGADYYLSKRTTLYTQLAVVNNHGAMNTGLSTSLASLRNEVSGTTVGANVGIRHRF